MSQWAKPGILSILSLSRSIYWFLPQRNFCPWLLGQKNKSGLGTQIMVGPSRNRCIAFLEERRWGAGKNTVGKELALSAADWHLHPLLSLKHCQEWCLNRVRNGPWAQLGMISLAPCQKEMRRYSWPLGLISTALSALILFLAKKGPINRITFSSYQYSDTYTHPGLV